MPHVKVYFDPNQVAGPLLEAVFRGIPLIAARALSDDHSNYRPDQIVVQPHEQHRLTQNAAPLTLEIFRTPRDRPEKYSGKQAATKILAGLNILTEGGPGFTSVWLPQEADSFVE